MRYAVLFASEMILSAKLPPEILETRRSRRRMARAKISRFFRQLSDKKTARIDRPHFYLAPTSELIFIRSVHLQPRNKSRPSVSAVRK